MNINNIIKLLKVYFTTNWRKDLYEFLIMIAIMIFCMLTGGGASLAFFVAYILICIYPSRIFKNLYQPSSRMMYLTLPATNTEKVTTGIALVNVYYMLVMFVALTLGFILGYGAEYIFYGGHGMLSNIGFGEAFSSFMKNMVSVDSLLMIYTAVSAFFFGAIYFKKRSFGATFGVMVCLGFIMSIVFMLTMQLNAMAAFATTSWMPYPLFDASFDLGFSEKTGKVMSYMLTCLTIVYFYAMSFLRMRETEA